MCEKCRRHRTYFSVAQWVHAELQVRHGSNERRLMDGHLQIIAVFVAGFHDSKCTDCFCSTQPQFIPRLLTRQVTQLRGRQRKSCFHPGL
jgi:hypothetical protein